MLRIALKILRHALKTDSAYYLTWKANIAMSFYDVSSKRGWNKSKLYLDANEAADRFLQQLMA